MSELISEYFTREEMKCQCGCGLDTMDIKTLEIADEVRRIVGHPVTPSSAARCETHNANVGGSKKSQHVKCRAIDLPVNNPLAVYEYLCNKYEGKYGFGVYDTFVHVDTRTNGPARWDFTTK